MYYNQNRVEEVREYRQQLYKLFKSEIEKRKIVVDMEKIEYTDESISGLLEKLTPAEKRKRKAKNPAEGLVVSTGFSINSFRVTGDPSVGSANKKYNTSLAPLISVGYMSPISRSFGKIFVYPQLKVYNYKNETEVNMDYIKKISTFKTSFIVAPVVNVGVNLVNADNFKYFFSLGGGMIFLANNKQIDKTIAISNGNVYQSSELKLSSLSYNANVTMGVTLKNKFSISATYNAPVPVANFPYYSPFHSSVQLLVGYKL